MSYETEKQYNKRPVVKVLRPVGRSDWRGRKASDKFADLLVSGSGTLHGRWRCAATDLYQGDCQQRHWHDSAYCYYHRKLKDGLLSPSFDGYPVFPLPEKGYIIEQEAA